jgi:hypothetical protein
MGALGIKGKKKRSNQGVWNHSEGFYDEGLKDFFEEQ